MAQKTITDTEVKKVLEVMDEESKGKEIVIPDDLSQELIIKADELDKCENYNLIRVLFKDIGEMFIISSGGANPLHLVRRRSFELVIKEWSTVRRKIFSAGHKDHIDTLKEEYEKMVSEENDDQLKMFPNQG